MGEAFNRRAFLKSAAAASVGVVGGLGAKPQAVFAQASTAAGGKELLFKISLAEWSLNRTLRAGRLDNLDFPAFAKKEFGIEAVEYVNQFFMEKGKDAAYRAELKKRCDDLGVKSVLIMCDDRVNLGDPTEAGRARAAETHYQWVEMAKFLGCHSIRVNARSRGTDDEQSERVADGLRRLCEFAKPQAINVIVENHGGLSSNGAWLVATIKKVAMDNCGTLPDFGNFTIGRGQEYDRYQGVREMMPLAKGVSAKSHVFDEKGDESQIDYRKMMKIVLDAGYHGYVGVEWEGNQPDEMEGVRLTKRLLERVRDEFEKR
ncbi:MAG: sugar phosphate isomerase/epimerase family protein [Planctomycetaceae bacterium]